MRFLCHRLTLLFLCYCFGNATALVLLPDYLDKRQALVLANQVVLDLRNEVATLQADYGMMNQKWDEAYKQSLEVCKEANDRAAKWLKLLNEEKAKVKKLEAEIAK